MALSTDFQSYDCWTSAKYGKKIGNQHWNSSEANKERNYSRKLRKKQKRPQKIHPLPNQTTPKVAQIHLHFKFETKTITLLFNAAPTANPEDVQKIRDAIKNATSLQEVERLTRLLKSGSIPDNFNANENGNGNGNGRKRYAFFIVQLKTNRCGILFF